MKTQIGQVSEEERDEIRLIYERKYGLTELMKTLSANDAIYDRLIIDMGRTSTMFDGWWQKKSEKYQWTSSENSRWEIDFETCDIFLVTE